MSLPHETCIHRPAGGLCPSCHAAYDADPTAWIDYGYHSAGLARWEAELDAMDAEAKAAIERIKELNRISDDIERRLDEDIPW